MSEVFDRFRKYLKEIESYDTVINLLHFDLQTAMPKKGFRMNCEATTKFSTERFKLQTSDELCGMLEELKKEEEFSKLDGDWQFIVDWMKRELDEKKRIPLDFYESFVKTVSEGCVAWEEAKKASDFSIFAPCLKKLIEMAKQEALYRYPDKDPYDVMLNTYEEGMNSEIIDGLFSEIKERLVPLIRKITKASKPDDSKFQRLYDLDGQRKTQKLLLDYIGFNWEKGGVAESEHPFTTNIGSILDVRVTNHFREKDAIDPMFSAIHEGGHAIFEQNTDEKLAGTVGASCERLGLHESQSRFYENILGRNKNFWIPVYDKIQKYENEFSDVSLDEFYREINKVEPSMIRTSADELTYCLHIIIRYEVEKAIFRDGVQVEELPALWNSKMQEYLGITPSNDAEGILQDMHWSDASFGYFPTYLLGNVYDGMIYEQMTKELGDIDTILAEGRILEITHWLNEKIHKYGNTRTSAQILEEVCHRTVSAGPILDYYEYKYRKLYGVD